ncbi:MAG TPA: hypothetical protein PL195_00320 [bacterium]|nr:hypothetical protein [bacterium]HQJ60438.1 hypothetical protein [bacterium]
MTKKILFILILTLVSGSLILSCSKKKPDEINTSVSQEDIDLLIRHKRNIDRITGKYDSEMQKVKQHQKPALIQKGKDEIDSYLKANNLNPVAFMRKSKKILKGYLAFQETSDAAIEKKIELLKNENLKDEEIKKKTELYKKTGEDLFREFTSELSDYEIQLIKSNLKNLSAIVK